MTNTYKTGQLPKIGDRIRAAKSSAWPNGRTGRVVRIFAADAQVYPGRVTVSWFDRSDTSHRQSRVTPGKLELVHCEHCSADGFMAVSDGAGGMDYDTCSRCYRADAVPALAQFNPDEIAF